MTTTRDTISEWFDRGVSKKKNYMIIVCDKFDWTDDKFDWTDYPVFYDTQEDVKKRAETNGSMEKIMEIYDLNKSKESQLNEHRTFAVEV